MLFLFDRYVVWKIILRARLIQYKTAMSNNNKWLITNEDFADPFGITSSPASDPAFSVVDFCVKDGQVMTTLVAVIRSVYGY